MNDTIAFMMRHRSIRRYADTPVEDAHVRAAVEAGQAASTSSAVQAYALLRINDTARREALIELTGGQPKVARCGAFFIVCGDTRRHRILAARAGRPYDARLEAFMLAVIDATLFAQNLVLAFESLGYGVCYIGGLRQHLPATDALLELPAGVYPLYGLCVGVPDETPMARPRLPLEAIFFDDRYPDDETMLSLIDEYDATYDEYLRERDGRAPRSWSTSMVEKFAKPRRPDLAAYYEGKGAELG